MRTFSIIFTQGPGYDPAGALKIVSREHGQADEVCGKVISLSIHADINSVGGNIRVTEETPWLAEFLQAFPDITPIIGHPMLGIPQEMEDLVTALKPTGYSALLVHEWFYDKLKKLTTSDFDRETEQRLLNLGVVGYFRGAPVILDSMVPPTPGYVLV